MKEHILINLGIASTIAVSILVAIWISSASCYAKWEKAGYETSYGPMQGCMVRVGGKWIPVETIRDVEVTK